MKNRVSLICTVLNEGDSIHKLLDSLAAQTLSPHEIIFVDGGSTDDTVAVLEDFAARQSTPVRVIVAPGANISRGRNIAIEAAAGPIIASTDAGVRLHPRWLAELVKPLRDNKAVQGVAGFFLPDPKTVFEMAMGATVLPVVSNINPESFLPSSRSVAFNKSAWETINGYPEWLDYCEDLIFDIRFKDEVGPFAFAPRAIAYFRPRGSLPAFFKQYYRYARGDGKADLWRRRHAIRYITYLVALPLLVALGLLVSPWWWLAGAALGGIGMFLTPYRRLVTAWATLSPGEKVQAALWIPIIRITGDVAKMLGYPVGWKWRLARLRAQPELKWQSRREPDLGR